MIASRFLLTQGDTVSLVRIGLLNHLQNVGHSVGQYNVCVLVAVEFLAECSTVVFLLLYASQVIHSELQFPSCHSIAFGLLART